MITEVLRAIVCLSLALIAWRGLMNSDWKITRALLCMAIIFVMAGEVVTAVNAASMLTGDTGLVRKVDWITIIAAIVTLWRAPRWLQKPTDKAAPA